MRIKFFGGKMRITILGVIFFSISTFLIGKEVLIIGIAGGSGSGKSTVAKKIHEFFPENSVLICQDNYYKDLKHLDEEERASVNFDHPDSIEFSLMEKQLSSLKAFTPIELPQYDFVTHTRKDVSIEIFPKRILIVEGLLLLSEPKIRDLLDIKLYIDTPEDIRLIRRIFRDQSERGRSVFSIITQYLETVRPMHQQFVEPSKRYADLIIPEGGENQMAIDIVVSKLKEEI